MASHNGLYDAADWKYKAEGNKHIVVSNKSGKVLRLRKTEPCTLNSGSSETDQDLAFIECVVGPLLRDSGLCPMPELVNIPEKFLSSLIAKIGNCRPDYRKKRPLDLHPSGVLMQDFCFVTRNKVWKDLENLGVELTQDTVAVEIKLKKGFLPNQPSYLKPSNPSNVCHFCKAQLYRFAVEKRFQKCSFYCPLDLFSGQKERMMYAISCLMHTPQNNFRVFLNGEMKYPQTEEETTSTATDMEEKLDALKDTIKAVFLGGTPLLNFKQVLQSTLLQPVCNSYKSTEFHSSNQSCTGFKTKQAMCHVKNGPFETRPPVRESTLSSTCTLGVILAAQRLDLNTVDKIHYYSKLVDSNRHNGLSVEEHMHSQYKNMADLNGNELTCSPIENLVKAANAVRNFLISKSFCDCSLIISFQRIVKTNPAIDEYVKLRLENSQKLANCDVIKDESGNLYLVSLAVVDTDPKSVSRIPLYFKQQQQFKEWWSGLDVINAD